MYIKHNNIQWNFNTVFRDTYRQSYITNIMAVYTQFTCINCTK